MTEKGRIGLIFGVVGLLAVGGLVYFVKVYQPAQKQAAAQTEIKAWEERFAAARTCLLGAAPASGKSSEALAVRELSPDAWDRSTCTKLIGRLSRGVADDTGLMPVEHAWMAIDRAASKVATSFATHIDPFGEAPDNRGKESPLPAALETLDAAHAALRETAGMGPPPTATAPSLPAAEIVTLTDGALPISSIQYSLLASGGGLVAFGTIKDKGEVQIMLAPGAAPKVTKLAPGALRAVPDSSWGAAGLLSQVAIGKIDATGSFGEMTSLPTTQRARILLAVGPYEQGVVVYGADSALTFARNTGSGFVAEPSVEVGPFAFALDPAGRGLVAWDVDDALKGVIVKGGTSAPAVVELGSGRAFTGCLTADRGWVGASGGQFISFDEEGARPHLLPGHGLLGCSATAALLGKHDTTHFAVCSDTCRTVDLTGTRPTTVATLAGDKVVGVLERGNVIGVWRENAPARFYATPATFTVFATLSDGKVLDVFGTMDDRVVIARIPLT